MLSVLLQEICLHLPCNKLCEYGLAVHLSTQGESFVACKGHLYLNHDQCCAMDLGHRLQITI